MKVEDLIILVDSREQRALKFRTMRSEKATLPTADYSVRGPGFDLRDTVLIERKSVADLVGSLGTGRERFERELERLAKVRWKALVIEGDMREIAAGTRFAPKMTPKMIMSPLHAWCWKHGIAVWPCPDRAWAARTVELLLWHAARYAVEETTKAGTK
ncbi:MAG: ERCC4 domain-containing protein [Candidatus Acidiferrales bacterium]